MKRVRGFILMISVIAFLLITTIPVGISESVEDPYIDLTVTDIQSWRQFFDKDKFNVRIRIKNIGNHHADAGFDVGLYQEVVYIPEGVSSLALIRSKEIIFDLGAGQWRDIYFWGIYWKSPQLGDYKMRFSGFVDCFDEVDESNENNNVLVDDVWWY